MAATLSDEPAMAFRPGFYPAWSQLDSRYDGDGLISGSGVLVAYWDDWCGRAGDKNGPGRIPGNNLTDEG